MRPSTLAVALLFPAVACAGTLEDPDETTALRALDSALLHTAPEIALELPRLVADVIPTVSVDLGAAAVTPVEADLVSAQPDARIIDFTSQEAEVEFGGVGMTVREVEGAIVVVGVLAGMPAERAGLAVGMEVIAVDGMSTEEMGVDQFVELVRGEVGQVVVLTVLDDSGEVAHEIAREPIVVMETRCDRVRRVQRQTEFGGVGIRVSGACGSTAIDAVEEGMPADFGGVRAGDRILSVDGLSTVGTPLWDIIGEIRGAPGTIVTLGLEDADGVARTVELERVVVAIPEQSGCTR